MYVPDTCRTHPLYVNRHVSCCFILLNSGSFVFNTFTGLMVIPVGYLPSRPNRTIKQRAVDIQTVAPQPVERP